MSPVIPETSQPDKSQFFWGLGEFNRLSAYTANTFGNAVQNSASSKQWINKFQLVLKALEDMEG